MPFLRRECGFPIKPGLRPRLCFEQPSIAFLLKKQNPPAVNPLLALVFIHQNDFRLFLPDCPGHACSILQEHRGGLAGGGSGGEATPPTQTGPRQERDALGRMTSFSLDGTSQMPIGVLQSSSGQGCLGEGRPARASSQGPDPVRRWGLDESSRSAWKVE